MGVSLFLARGSNPYDDALSTVVRLEADLMGDGRPGVAVTGEGLEAIGGLRIPALVAGTFNLQLRAIDALGCVEATGLRRPVTVRRR